MEKQAGREKRTDTDKGMGGVCRTCWFKGRKFVGGFLRGTYEKKNWLGYIGRPSAKFTSTFLFLNNFMGRFTPSARLLNGLRSQGWLLRLSDFNIQLFAAMLGHVRTHMSII